ncbi:hypothetical protein L7F22_049346 [Adiantum nelumboides]|nr:hypothetical protein [Adiantum nelumboides]
MLKQKLISQPVLILVDLTKPFDVQCDACGDCLGAVLLQEGHALASNDGKPTYKARVVVKEFSPVVKMTALRCVLALVAKVDMELVHMDVKTTFLHGDLHEDIYMQQPEGFGVKGKEHLVCKLKKSFYGLKQAPREWYHKLHMFMFSQGYRQSDIDHCLSTK